MTINAYSLWDFLLNKSLNEQNRLQIAEAVILVYEINQSQNNRNVSQSFSKYMEERSRKHFF